ncbi:predicted protein [Lichtheimia corymbifera JMRC:FSU:9682]|uniref:Uncharacterized protein n=1 Tax=Lichtheimia corymbifera JMRC:FSU:9682 TaxID=1263082 RepID=A0A068RMF6_9FUNG|nr:predicted protein [Lichtheimia corymbifera JMRC:FSU:9682]
MASDRLKLEDAGNDRQTKCVSQDAPSAAVRIFPVSRPPPPVILESHLRLPKTISSGFGFESVYCYHMQSRGSTCTSHMPTA